MSFNYTQKKVFVGLSGGVDSAVSAALLKKEGYDVTGVFIKAWTPVPEQSSVRGIAPKFPCTWREDRRSAMRVAAILDIPFLTLDLEKEYKKEVVDYMIAEYKTGRTPNPDVMCNKEIKFGHFLKFALDKGADFVATGHYARTSKRKLPKKVIEKSLAEAKPGSEDFSERSFFWQLSEGADKNKDQSYFLWTLTQDQLKHILFPIGHLQKSEVRRLAGKFDLPQATRKDSQGLCFLGKVDMKEFLSRYIPQKKGDVLDLEGKKIGTHSGALFFTIGERHGFTITKKSDKETPLYVIAKDIKNNTITVASKISKITLHKSSFQGQSLELKSVNIINPTSLKLRRTKEKLLCRIRYRQEKVGCKIEGSRVIFDNPQIGVSPGQSLVLYDGEICLGGGVIK